MLRIQMIGLALMATLVMSAVAAAGASAAEHLWLVNGKLVASPVKVHSLGLLLLTDKTAPGGETIIHCHGFNDGTIGPHALDLILAITAELLGTNPRITCNYVKQGACESSPRPLALAVGLPWHTELYLEGTEVRDHITSDTPGGTIGWKVVCKAILLGTVTDECTNKLTSVKVTNVAGGVEGEFDAKSSLGDCKVGTEAVRTGAGKVVGTTLVENISSTEKLTFNL